MPPIDQESTFLFVTCQVGAEGAVKEELARRWPDVHAAYSRPGLTYLQSSSRSPHAA